MGGVTCWAAVGIAAVLGLAGCTSSGSVADPPASTGTTTSPSSTASATTSGGAATSSRRGADVDVPKAAQKHTKKGAEAFAKFYMHTYSIGARDGTPQRLASLSSQNCRGCAALVSLIETDATKGRTASKDFLQVKGVNVRPDSTTDRPKMDLLIEEKPYSITDENGKVAKRIKGSNYRLVTGAVWKNGAWSMSQIKLVT